MSTVNRILYSDDCLNVLNDELALPTDSVDLIYLDPPFNSKSHYNLPFKGKDRDARPVEAFNDTWTWGTKEQALHTQLASGPVTRNLADIITLAQRLGQNAGGGSVNSMAAYLTNMAARLLPMRRVLKPTGSIYLHCDPTASHYLKLLMDAIFGQQNFRNEIVWSYQRWTGATSHFQRMHDIIFMFAKSKKSVFNQLTESHSSKGKRRHKGMNRETTVLPGGALSQVYVGTDGKKAMRDVWEISFLNANAKERLGYPTQKPTPLLERIIKASSNPGDLILDPFSGCGTAVHAAEKLGRRWIGIDISAFAVGLVRGRILNNYQHLTTDDVLVRGVPVNVAEAQALADRDKFEFEKWVCGAIGAEGMFHDPGTRGADGGVDGVLKFFPFRMGKTPKSEFAIVQVKGGTVTADEVRALSTTVDRFGATAGVFVCFGRFMRTVENQRGVNTFRDDSGIYPVIQGFSVEELLADKRPDLPLYGYRRQGGRISTQAGLLKE